MVEAMTDTAVLSDPSAFLRAMRDDELHLADSFSKATTGVDATVFIGTAASGFHKPFIEVATDPRDGLNPHEAKAAAVAIDGRIGGGLHGEMPVWLFQQALRFIELNRAALLDYWHHKIPTDELQRRLRAIA
jgi:hypothetical protein